MTDDNAWLADYLEQGRQGLLAAPPSAFWIVTRACNLKCHYCFADARKRDPDELTTVQAFAVLDDLAEHGVAFVTYLGGEPLMRRDLFDLVDYSTDLGIYTAVLSNGLLVKRGAVQRLKDAGCQMLGISIDSNDPLVHDAIRGVRGSLIGAKRAVREAVASDMRCSVRLVITEKSIAAVPDLFRWALDEGVEELIVIPIFMVGRAAGTANDRRADILGKQLFFEALRELRKLTGPLGLTVPHEDLACAVGIELSPPQAAHRHAGHAVGFEKTVGCKVGRFFTSIQPNGEVYLCPFVHHPIGSLRTQSIAEIWQHPLLRKAREHDLGCLARSVIHQGRLDVPDPTYRRTTEELLEALAGAAAPDQPKQAHGVFVPFERSTTRR